MMSPHRAVTLTAALAATTSITLSAAAEQYPPQPAPAQPPAVQPAPAQPPPAQPPPAQPGYQQPPPAQPPPAQPPPAQPGYQQPPPAQPGYQQPPPAQPGYQQQPPPGAPPGAMVMPTRLGSWPMQFVLSAERLFGFHSWTGTMEIDNGMGGTIEPEATGSGLFFLWGSGNTGTDEFHTNPFAVPRLAADLFVIPGLSVGLSLGYISTSGEADSGVPGDTTENFPDISAFAIAPRIGYAAMFSENVGIWPRAGLTYVTTTTTVTATDPITGVETDFETTTDMQNFSVEALLVISPATHFAFTVGPVIDLGVGGGRETSIDGDIEPDSATVTNFGVAGGLLGYF